MENKISRENAESQFEKLKDFYGIDIAEAEEILDNDEDADSESKKEARKFKAAIKMIQNRYIKSIMAGDIEIIEENDAVCVKQNLHRPFGEPTRLSILYGEVTARAKIEMSRADEKNPNEQLYRLLGVISGVGYKPFTCMKGRDMKVAETIGTLFLYL